MDVRTISAFPLDLEFVCHFDDKIYSSKLVMEKIQKLIDPQTIYWYFGPYGLSDSGAHFYKKNFLHPLENKSITWLYDLTAWRSLRAKNLSFEDNKFLKKINDFGLTAIKTVTSKGFFEWLNSENNPEIIAYVNDTIFKRESIFKASESHAPSNIKICEVFESHSKMLEEIKDLDCQKVYSALQYLEGIYLITLIAEKKFKEDATEVNISFVLPNDEQKYYNQKTFELDARFILQHKLAQISNLKKLTVYFHSFSFNFITDRPYLGGKIIEEKNVAVNLFQKTKI